LLLKQRAARPRRRVRRLRSRSTCSRRS